MSFLCSGILTTLDNSLYLSAGPGSCLCTSLAFAYEPVVSVLPGLILHPLSHEWELWRGGTLCDTSEVLDGTKDTTLKGQMMTEFIPCLFTQQLSLKACDVPSTLREQMKEIISKNVCICTQFSRVHIAQRSMNCWQKASVFVP